MAKTKALISCAVTVKLICVFVLHMQIDGFLIHRLIYEGHSISNAILTIFFSLNMLLKYELAFLKHKFNSPSARQFNT